MADISANIQQDFTASLLNWYDRHGRRDLPWHANRDAYCIWLSEIMLQQTQVQTVIPYYQRFIARFPDLQSLATAKVDDVLALWSGLGYYARARNLHRTAVEIVESHNGTFPTELNELIALPGIGRSTAGAILAFSEGQRHPILDGNVKRVLSRCFGIEGYPGRSDVNRRLWSVSEQLLPNNRIEGYTQAIMDLGATICVRRNPACEDCPVMHLCYARRVEQQHQFPGKKPKTLRQRRQASMLVIRNNEGACLLEKRPASGIWGGLWVFPTVDEVDADLTQWTRTRLGVEAGDFRALPIVRHGFTHFELEIQPVLGKVRRDATRVMDGNRLIWYNPQSDTELGIPAVVGKIFNALDDSNNDSNG